MKKITLAFASVAVLLLSGCFYSHTVMEVPVQQSPAYSPPGQTTSETTTTNDDGTIRRRSTTTYSNP